jgi:hypothetical protein
MLALRASKRVGFEALRASSAVLHMDDKKDDGFLANLGLQKRGDAAAGGGRLPRVRC